MHVHYARWLLLVAALAFLALIAARRTKQGIVFPVGIAAVAVVVLHLALHVSPPIAAATVFVALAIADLLRAFMHRGPFVVGGAGLCDALIVVPAAAYFFSGFIAGLG